MKKASLILFTVLSLNSFSWNFNGLLGARSAGMAGLGVSTPGAWTAENNVAGLGFQEFATLGLHYENRFLVSGLGYGGFNFAVPIKNAGVGLSFTNFGSSLYRESKVGLGYGISFGDKLSMGLQLSYLQTFIGNDYGVRNNVAGSFGVMAKLTDELTFGAQIFNLNRAKLDDYDDERVPTIIRAGVSYEFSDKVMLSSDVEKELNEETIVRLGMEYHPVEKFYFRTGVSTNPYTYSFGFGVELDNFKVDAASGFHPVLGVSPVLSLVYTFSKE